MKVALKDIHKLATILDNLDYEFDDMSILFPIENCVSNTDEYGIETKTFKAETQYGNTLVPVVALYSGDARLAYVPSTSMMAFNLAEFITITYQKDLSTADSDFLCKYECGLAVDNNIRLTNYYFLDNVI